MKTAKTNTRSSLLVICLILLPLVAFPQINHLLNTEREVPTALDSMLDAIRVPEIDPRQYIVIYEWEESNEKKSRKGIKDKYRLREIERYRELIVKKEGEFKKKKADVEKEMKARASEVLRVLNTIDSLEGEFYALKQTEVSERTAIMKGLQELYKEEGVYYDYNRDYFEDARAKFEQKRKQEQRQQEKDLVKINWQLGELNKHKDKIKDQRSYIKWEYAPEQDSTKYKRRKPFDFFEDVGKTYSGLQESYMEYYNHVAWRNAGTPDWEPIWWLNQYPWPNMDYRNIDLLDQDYRDQHFALIPYQKYKYVDRKSVLRIVFDKTQLARNEHFKGSIGLDAFLYGGPDGDPREIEINPYSVIGKERESIGLSNRPAGELADHLITLILEAGRLGTTEVYRLYDDDNVFEQLKEELNGYQNQIRGLIPGDLSKLTSQQQDSVKYVMSKDRTVQQFCSSFNEKCQQYNISLPAAYYKICSGNYSLNKLDSFIDAIGDSFKQSNKEELHSFNYTLERIYSLRKDIKLVVAYLNYFEEEYGNTQAAFLNLIGKDKIAFNHSLSRIEEKVSAIDSTLIKISPLSEHDSQWRTKYNGYKTNAMKLTVDLEELYTLMWDFVRIKGSLLDQVIEMIWEADPTFEEKRTQVLIPGIKNTWEETLETLDKLRYIYNDSKSRPKLREYLAEKAGEILYQDLVYGTIDLDLGDAQDGDMLFIRMYWNKDGTKGNGALKQKDADEQKDSDEGPEYSGITNKLPERDGVALYVAKFKLIERGWKRQTFDNAMMIHRVREDLLRTNYPLSPSELKLTGSAVMTWGIRNDRRVNKKLKFDPSTNLPRFRKDGSLKYNKFIVGVQKTFKWLEPSFGVNFSYLDFNTTDRFELGIGPTMGIWGNTVSVSTGWNMMELKEKPFYIGIGVSIINLGSKVRNALSEEEGD